VPARGRGTLFQVDGGRLMGDPGAPESLGHLGTLRGGEVLRFKVEAAKLLVKSQPGLDSY
jgi:hypothetical protein